MKIELIQANIEENIPPFFIEYGALESTLLEKIEMVSLAVLDTVSDFFYKLYQASINTIDRIEEPVQRFNVTYFTLHPYHCFLETFNFLFSVACFFISNMINLYLENFQRLGHENLDRGFIDRILIEGNINPEHLNVSHSNQKIDYPSSIKIDDLLTIFEKINFSRADEFGYIPIEMRKEGSNVLTTQNIQDSLERLIANFNGNLQIMLSPINEKERADWYDQLKKGILGSIHLSNEQLRTFSEKEGAETLKGINLATQLDDADVQTLISGLSKKLKDELRDILDQRARMIIELAKATNYCATRYVQTVSQLIEGYRGNVSVEDLPLSMHINHVLTNLRVKILDQKASLYARNLQLQTQILGISAHYRNIYMIAIGRLMNVPGTDTIQENYVSETSLGFDRRLHLLEFLSVYDFSEIMSAFKEEFKKDFFKHKIYEWIKTQSGNWNKEFYDEALKDIFKIKASSKTERQKQEEIFKVFRDRLYQHVESHQKERLLEDELITDLIEQARGGSFLAEVCKPLETGEDEGEFVTKLMTWILIEHQIVKV